MSITIHIAAKADAGELIKTILQSHYNIDETYSAEIFNYNVKPHFNTLKDDIYFLAETCYVDKFYRDSYYHYFSSKLKPYQRDCIRLSLFQGTIDYDDFINPDKHKSLIKKYRGFYVLRPTFPHIMGRSVIDPEAINSPEMRICLSKFNTTANGIKCSVNGFPHSSQDTETITCAETTLWAIMEYFGNKYPYYKPTYPSTILKHLSSISFERQIPSRGLLVDHISYALKEFGFGTRIYSKVDFKNDFEALLSCYIESGIPLVIAIQNPNAGIGHALLVIGREKDFSKNINEIKKINAPYSEITIYDYDTIPKRFIFIDDNKPTYQRATLSCPAENYIETEWKKCEITHFITPLYPKIYLEAYQAKECAINHLLSGFLPVNKKSKIVLRTFLASSRSYKDEIIKNKEIGNDFKSIILGKEFPKFIWVAEISTKALMAKGKVDGMIILDATEPNLHDVMNPLIMAVYKGNLLEVQNISGNFSRKMVDSKPFSMYAHNLKSSNNGENN